MMDSLLLPALSDRLFQLLFDFLPGYAAEGGTYTGLILEGLPMGEWLPQLLDKLTEDERCYITLVGFSSSEEKALFKKLRPRTDKGVEKAIDTRHNRPPSSWHLVVLRGPREPRIHSLSQRGYGIIGPDEIARFGAQQQAECSLNVPHITFWQFLAQPVGGISLPLVGILEMLNYAASSPHPDLYNTLPLLDLLPDKHLFQHIDKLPARLHENAALVARLQEHEHADLRRAFEISRSESEPQEATDLRAAYAAFARLKPGQAVRDWADSIPLARARRLLLSPLNGKPASPHFPPAGILPIPPINPTPGPDEDEPGNEGDGDLGGGPGTPPSGGYEPGSGPDGPEPDEDDDDDITTLRRRTREKVNARPARPKLEASLDEAIIRRAAEISPAELLTETTLLTKDLRRNLRKFAEGKLAKTVWLLQSPSCYVDHPHERTSARLTQAFCGPHLLGGRLDLPAAMSLTTAARADLTPITADTFGPAYENKLRQALADLAPLLTRGVDAAAIFSKWLAARELLAREADLLTAAPLAALLSDSELRSAARASQEAYRELCQTLADHYDVLRREGADVVLPDILRLDTVEVRSSGKDTGLGGYVLLAPLHPLVLWKYAELADVLEDQANEGAGKNLHDLLPEWPESMVEPLRAVVIPDITGRVQPLAFAGRCGTWPEYQPSGTVRERSSGGLLVAAAHKMALLYPPVIDSLRLVVHHPTRLEGFTRDLRTLLASKPRPEKPVFRSLHLTLTYPLGGHPLSLPIEWAGWLREGELIVEQTERSDLRPGEKAAPAHLLLVPATYRIDNLQVAREPSPLHPLSLPRRLRYQTYRERPILEPRSQQSDDINRYPFGAFHELISRFGGRPDQEASGMLTPEVPPEHLPTVLTGAVWAILPEHPYPLSDEQLALKHDTTQHGQMVITGYGRRFRDRVKWMLEQMDYVPKPDKLTTLLRDLDGVGQTGLFHLISSKDTSGFSDTALKGQFGLAVALRWYEQNVAKTPYHVVLSLDSALARRWLCQRDTNQRTDLLGLRYGNDGQWYVDLIEVKAYSVGPNPDNGPGTAGEQLRAMAKVLLPILQQTGGDLLTDCRRELLREQLYLEGKEYLKGPSDIEPRSWAEWIDQLDALLNGTQKAKLNLMLLEVNLNRNEDSGVDIIDGDPNATDEAYRRDLEFWHINQPDIQTLVSDLVVPTPPPTPPSPPPTSPTPPSQPSSPVGQNGKLDKSPSGTVEVVVPDSGSGMIAPSNSLPSPTLTQPALQPETKAAPSKEIQNLALRLYEVLQDFHLSPAASIDPYQADIGPSIIRFKVRLERNQKLPQLQARAIDMQRELSLTVVPRIDNLSGTTYVAVEIPRPDPQIAPLSPILLQGVPTDIGPLPIPVGVAPNGQVKWLSLASLPHLLVGGTSGSGKTRFLWSLLLSLRHLSPAGSVEWVLIDPKQTDFTIFNNWPEVRGGRVIIEPEEAVETLQELLATELVSRTNLLRQYECVNLLEYRAKVEAPPLPYLVVVIDEYADLVESLPKRERTGFELAVGRLAQRARNVGIHLVIATQRPDSKIISGNLKNNLGGRIAFQLASGVDSRVVLDQNGAENLLGQGDLLVRHGGALQRLQGFFVTTDELRKERNN